jgi:SAM-dependent methyltransferase
MEFRYRLIAPLHGKTLLDVGCGDGLNTVILARLGARVTGLDISPAALELARRRAEINGVADRTNFICAPLELADLKPGSFDVVWGDGILHHVLADLETVMKHLARACKPTGMMVFSEPLNEANFLRRIRARIPVHTDATPDERPLLPQELELVSRYFGTLRTRKYGLLGRLDRFILESHNYERSSLIRRVIANAVAAFDYFALSVPLLEKLGGMGVLYGSPSSEAAR